MALDPESEDTHTYPLDDDILIPFQPCSCISIPGRELSFLHCGEFIVLREHLAIDADVDGEPVTLHAKVGLILRITTDGNHQRILLSLLILASEFPTAIIREEAAPPPDRRQYVEYPQHVVMSNITKWFSASEILSKAFLFTAQDLDNGSAAYAVGMENAFHARYKWEKDATICHPIICPEQATLGYFPFDNCYSRRNWDLLVRVATLINRELSRSFIAQHTSKSIHLFLSKAEFEYLKLRMMPAVEVYKKGGLSTNTLPRKCAARESIKRRVKKEYLQVDTAKKFDRLQCVLGSAIVLGLRGCPPSVPSLRVADQYK